MRRVVRTAIRMDQESRSLRGERKKSRWRERERDRKRERKEEAGEMRERKKRERAMIEEDDVGSKR
ncbi:hypothetical protein CSUI_004851 [Cystoisospora suis]|uniref:Uncharacterized protein n=1 Tax=Cystoisospora suis TaxID=483139 RepID=A0A2C6KZG3_9APIC|nr:hypothetical protein CSUI_004851 [Cystoisospora suis]